MKKRGQKKELSRGRKITIRILNIIIVLLLLLIVYKYLEFYIPLKKMDQQNNTNIQLAKNEYGDYTCAADGYIHEDVSTKLDEDSYDSNELIGYIQMPETGVEAAILQGEPNEDQETAMAGGVSHDPVSKLPGNGNTVLLGHRNLEFAKLEDVKIGDGIIINIDGNLYLYQITDTKIFDEYDVESVFFESDLETLILYTCYPFAQYAPITDRFAVYATRVDKLEC